MTNVLVTCGGGFQGLTLYKSLKNIEGLVLHLFDVNEENLSKYVFDYFLRSEPIQNKEEYINQLTAYTSQSQIKFIFPSATYDLEILSQLKITFKEKYDCIIVTPDIHLLSTFNDKLNSYSFFKKIGLPVQNVLKKEKIKSFPVLAKPNVGFGSKGVQVIYDHSEFEDIDEDSFHFVTYFKSFDEFSIDFSVNQFGQCNNPIIRKREVVTGGFAVVTETNNDYYCQFANYLSLIKSAFSNVKMIGIYNIQFLVNINNDVFFTDLNSRIGTSCILSNYKGESILNHFFGFQSELITNVKSVRVLEEYYYPQIDKEKIKAIVFDLDDTLISNKQFILSRALVFYNTLNLSERININDFKINTLALLNEGKAPFLIDELKSLFNLKENIEELIGIYRRSYPNDIELYDDVVSTISYLKKEGYKLYVLTDNPKKSQTAKIHLLGDFSSSFDGVFYTDDLNSEKPNRKCFDNVIISEGLEASEIVMVGDNEYRDVYGALQAKYAYAFHLIRNDGIVSHSLFDDRMLQTNSFQINSLHALKFIM